MMRLEGLRPQPGLHGSRRPLRGLLTMRVWHFTAKQGLILRSPPQGGRLEGWPQKDCALGFFAYCPDFACRTAPCRAESSVFCKFRDHAILQMICPTCQVNFVESEVVAAARLLCMGLFSIFWFGARARRARAWPQADPDALLTDQFRFQHHDRYQAIHAHTGAYPDA